MVNEKLKVPFMLLALGYPTQFRERDPAIDEHKPFNPILDKEIPKLQEDMAPPAWIMPLNQLYGKASIPKDEIYGSPTHNEDPSTSVHYDGNDIEADIVDIKVEIPGSKITLLRMRECFNPKCKRILDFFDFEVMNDEKYPLKQLKKIWNSPHIELYCCTCYKKQGLFEKQAKKEERLLKKAERIMEKFGFDFE